MVQKSERKFLFQNYDLKQRPPLQFLWICGSDLPAPKALLLPSEEPKCGSENHRTLPLACFNLLAAASSVAAPHRVRSFNDSTFI